MVGILLSFWDGLFLGAMLVSGSVSAQTFSGRNISNMYDFSGSIGMDFFVGRVQQCRACFGSTFLKRETRLMLMSMVYMLAKYRDDVCVVHFQDASSVLEASICVE